MPPGDNFWYRNHRIHILGAVLLTIGEILVVFVFKLKRKRVRDCGTRI